MKKKLPKSLFVLGGAASGKSVWAETFVKSADLPSVYLATAQAFDAETEARITLHKTRRKTGWRSIEVPFELAAALDDLKPDEPALIDCATMWLTNHMLAEHDLAAEQARLTEALRRCAAPWIMVSNEVGQGIVPDNALARRFREAQGRLNIALAAEAEVAVQVIAGLPQVLKGSL